MKNSIKIGVLGIQGDIEENVSCTISALKRARRRGEIKVVRHSEEIENLDGLIIPGGESTCDELTYLNPGKCLSIHQETHLRRYVCNGYMRGYDIAF